MMRWAFLAVLVALAGGAAAALLARLAGRPGGRASILVSVVAHWLGAYALWTFAGGLALRYGALSAYDGWAFVLLALAAGAWHYRIRVRSGPEPARAVFVGGQLAWLAIVLARNGFL